MEEAPVSPESWESVPELTAHPYSGPAEQAYVTTAHVIGDNPMAKQSQRAPFYFLGPLVTVMLDLVWAVPEVAETISGALPLMLLTSTVLGLVCLLVVTYVQHHLAGDRWGVALAKGLVLGVAAAVPYPVVGTMVGVPLLAWAGIDGFRARRSTK